MRSTARRTPWSVAYADGSANLYTFSQASADAEVLFEYAPTTPERSSSGTYSGGEPRKAQLAATDPRIGELWRRVERLESDRSLHAGSRMMGTGAFTVTTPAGAREFIIEDGAALEELDELVEQFRHED